MLELKSVKDYLYLLEPFQDKALRIYQLEPFILQKANIVRNKLEQMNPEDNIEETDFHELFNFMCDVKDLFYRLSMYFSALDEEFHTEIIKNGIKTYKLSSDTSTFLKDNPEFASIDFTILCHYVSMMDKVKYFRVFEYKFYQSVII